MSNSPTIPCDAPGYRVKINISVVDNDGKEQTEVTYLSPESTFGFAVLSMDANITVLAASWAKAIAEHCPDDSNAMAMSVASEADD